MHFGRRPVLFHERDTGESEFEIYMEFFTRQISLETSALVTSRVHHENGRRPDRVEAVEIFSVIFYVDVERYKVFVDVGRQTGIAVRLVLESLAGTSGGCGAEIDQQRFILIFGLV